MFLLGNLLNFLCQNLTIFGSNIPDFDKRGGRLLGTEEFFQCLESSFSRRVRVGTNDARWVHGAKRIYGLVLGHFGVDCVRHYIFIAMVPSDILIKSSSLEVETQNRLGKF